VNELIPKVGKPCLCDPVFVDAFENALAAFTQFQAEADASL
jgi:hypothetical protein